MGMLAAGAVLGCVVMALVFHLVYAIVIPLMIGVVITAGCLVFARRVSARLHR